MSFSKPIQCYHSRTDPIWPDVPFKVSIYCIRKHHEYQIVLMMIKVGISNSGGWFWSLWLSSPTLSRITSGSITVPVSVTSSFYILDGLHVTYLSLGSKVFLESVRREQQSFFSINNLLREKSALCWLECVRREQQSFFSIRNVLRKKICLGVLARLIN